jgi:3D (Asp-Asp-Asp) domain-containing protein
MRARMRAPRTLPALALCCAFAVACASGPGFERSLEVTATAYNSTRAQTGPTPQIAAWGDRLRPGMKAIAVSRDLEALGMTRGARVRIEGFKGEYVVLDRMAKRWKRRIDIYMGNDVAAARAFGKRKVRITWAPPEVERAGWF